MKHIIVTILAILGCINLGFGQNESGGELIVSGIVIGPDEKVIPYTHIIDENRNIGTAADDFGYFRIKVDSRDTIKFTAVGFKPFYLSFSDSLFKQEYTAIIRLETDIYSIKEVFVMPYPTYQRLKNAVANMELPENEFQFEEYFDEVRKLALYEARQANAGGPVIIEGPVTALWMALSKEGRKLREYQMLVAAEARREAYAYKYGTKLIMRVTGLPTVVEAEKFMSFCNFSDEFIEKASEYEVLLAINLYYEKYRGFKND